MEHEFTATIMAILDKEFGDLAPAVFSASALLNYVNIKTRAASRGSKSRASFGNLYALYVLIEDYVSGGFHESGSYSQYQGASFTKLFKRQRELPFGKKLQNHHLNTRLNDEFKRFLARLRPRLDNPPSPRYHLADMKEHLPVKVGCLFAAIGGFCRAFREAGAHVLWANEKDRFARETFVLNFPGVRHIHKPIEEVTVIGDKLDPVDILTGGFPCQPFSIAGEKLGLKDKRGMLFLHITRLIREFGKQKPKILLLENVEHFRNHDCGRTFRRVQSEIQKAGYWFSDKDARVLNTATHTTIPQNRDRIFLVAMSCDHFPSNNFKFPEALPEGSLKKVRDFLDLDRRAEDVFYFKPSSQYHPMFEEAMAKGRPDSVYQLRRSYVRENMSGMCFTLMANMGDGGHNVPVIRDRWGIRKLTPVECARLQGYGRWFKIPKGMSRTQIGKQIGNSVTIPLVVRLAENCVSALSHAQRKHGIESGASL